MMAQRTQELYGNTHIAAPDQEAARLRNLAKARVSTARNQKQQDQYTQKIGAEIQDGQYTPQTQTDAQKKHALKKRQQWRARMIAARKRKKTKGRLAKKYEKTIRGYNRVLWPLLYVAAFSDALFDLLTIPVISTVLSICTSLYINFALWSVGKRNQRAKRRIMRAAVSTLDLIPIINLIPFSVLIVYKTQEDAKKDVKKAQKALKKIAQA